MLSLLKREHPAAALVKEALEGASNTPDMWQLEMQAEHFIFVYNELKRGHRFNKIMQGEAEFHGEAFTWLPHAMFKRVLGAMSYPILLRKQVEGAPYERVRGELYSVTAEKLSSLDKMQGNEVHFKRRRTKIKYVWRSVMWGPEGSYLSEPKTMNLWAWMYTAKDTYWRPRIFTDRLYFERQKDGRLFEPVKTFQPNDFAKPYYAFTPLEYKDEWEHPSTEVRKPLAYDIPLIGNPPPELKAVK